MIEIKQVKTQDEVNYTFVEKLMHTAFPQEDVVILYNRENILIIISGSVTTLF